MERWELEALAVQHTAQISGLTMLLAVILSRLAREYEDPDGYVISALVSLSSAAGAGGTGDLGEHMAELGEKIEHLALSLLQ